VHNDAHTPRTRLALRRLIVLSAAGMITVTTACSDGPSDSSAAASSTDRSHPAVDAGADPASTLPPGSTSGSTAGQLVVDPCALLTVPEIEGGIGSGVVRGGFGEDLPGRCTYSIGGDVGAGVVGISVDEPYLCGPLLQALESGSLDPSSAVRVDVGDGGVVEPKAGSIQFAVGGGCVGIVGSDAGKPLGQDVLVSLATAASGRVG
jgi:hypothetical protein